MAASTVREHAVACWTRPVCATRQNHTRIFDRSSATCQPSAVKILGPIDRATCQRLLDPHLRALDSCFHAAWSRWQKWLGTCEGPPADVSPRTRANALYDFIAAEAVKSFAGAPGVLVAKKRGFLVIRFGDKVALRFKKFHSATLRTSDNGTTQSTLFQSQRLEFSDSAVQSMTHVVAGYLLDDLALDIDRLAITCTMDGQHVWAPIELISDSNVRATPASDPTTARPRVRSTRKARKSTSSEG